MLGAYGVGKTSLVKSFVYSIFDDRYHSTIGVKIDKKLIEIEGQTLELLLWDIAGEDDCFTVPPAYVRGTSGYLLVIDGTRRMTLDQAVDIQRRTEDAAGKVPFLALINKADLKDQWELGPQAIEDLAAMNWTVSKSSAKLGTGVNEAFYGLGKKLLADPKNPL